MMKFLLALVLPPCASAQADNIAHARVQDESNAILFPIHPLQRSKTEILVRPLESSELQHMVPDLPGEELQQIERIIEMPQQGGGAKKHHRRHNNVADRERNARRLHRQIAASPASLVQFLPGMALGGGLDCLAVAGMFAAIAACCIYLTRKFWKWWKTFDFRETFPVIGRFMLKKGWDKFAAFPVVIKVYSISEHREPCRLRIRFRSKIYETKVSTADGKWGSTTRMMVPQGCDRGEIEAVLGHREGRGKVEGSYSFSVWNAMLQEHPVDPKNIDGHQSTFFGVDQHMTLMNAQQTRAGTVHIMFTLGRNLEDEVPMLSGMNPSSYALADMLKGNIPEGSEIPAKGEFKLQALANVLRGTLAKGSGARAGQFYFAIIKRETVSSKDKDMDIVEARAQGLVKSRWLLAWWNDERHFRSKPTSPSDNISLLQCTSCRAHPSNPTRFMIRYASNSERHEMQLKRVSHERDMWVEGLSLAIAEVHNLKRNPGDKFASRKKTAGEKAASSATDHWKQLTNGQREQYWRNGSLTTAVVHTQSRALRTMAMTVSDQGKMNNNIPPPPPPAAADASSSSMPPPTMRREEKQYLDIIFGDQEPEEWQRGSGYLQRLLLGNGGQRPSKEKRVLYIFRGSPGCGKSTHAHRYLCRDLGHEKFVKDGPEALVHIASADDFFMFRDDDNVKRYYWDRKLVPRNHELNQQRIKIAMGLGVVPLFADNTNVAWPDMAPYLKIAEENGYSVKIVDPSEFCKDWNNLRLLERRQAERSSINKDLDSQIVRRMISQFQPSFPPHASQNWIDRVGKNEINSAVRSARNRKTPVYLGIDLPHPTAKPLLAKWSVELLEKLFERLVKRVPDQKSYAESQLKMFKKPEIQNNFFDELENEGFAFPRFNLHITTYFTTEFSGKILTDSYWREGKMCRFRANALVFIPHRLLCLAVDILPAQPDDDSFGLGKVPTVPNKHHHVTILFKSPARAKHSNQILKLIDEEDPQFLKPIPNSKDSRVELVSLNCKSLPKDLTEDMDDEQESMNAIVLRLGENDPQANSLIGHFVRQFDDAGPRSDWSGSAATNQKRGRDDTTNNFRYWADQGYSQQQIEEWIREKSDLKSGSHNTSGSGVSGLSGQSGDDQRQSASASSKNAGANFKGSGAFKSFK
eukprot:gene88-825_t